MDDPGEFFDPIARVYDDRLAQLDDDALADDVLDDGSIPDDAAFYRELARVADGPALEVGVGTGRIYLELLADGLDVDGEQYRVVAESALDDEVEQVARWRRALYRGDELVAERETPIAMIPKRQFELLFELAGFSAWEVYGGFHRESPLEDADREMVLVVQR